MKIEVKTIKTPTISNIEAGDLFMYNTEYFLRLPPNDYILKTKFIPVYNLSSNLLQHFSDPKVAVTPVTGKLVIE